MAKNHGEYISADLEKRMQLQTIRNNMDRVRHQVNNAPPGAIAVTANGEYINRFNFIVSDETETLRRHNGHRHALDDLRLIIELFDRLDQFNCLDKEP